MIHLWQVLAGCGVGITLAVGVVVVLVKFADVLSMIDDSGEY